MNQCIKSVDVTMFPSGYRGVVQTSGDPSFDLEARLTSEKNLTGLITTVCSPKTDSPHSFVISDNIETVDTDSYLNICLRGYTFRLKITEYLTGTWSAWTNVWAKIKLSEEAINISNPETVTAGTVQTLIGQQDASKFLDIKTDRTVGDNTDYDFTGLDFSNTEFTLGEDEYQLKVLTKESSNWKVPANSKIKFSSEDIGLLDSAGTGVSGSLASVLNASEYTGNAASATKLKTPAAITVDLSTNDSADFDGSAPITPGVTGTLESGNGGTGLIPGAQTGVLMKDSANINAPMVLGTVPINMGGTGKNTAAEAIKALLGGNGTTSQFVKGDGSLASITNSISDVSTDDEIPTAGAVHEFAQPKIEDGSGILVQTLQPGVLTTLAKTTVVDSSSTDSQLPTAKGVNTAITNATQIVELWTGNVSFGTIDPYYIAPIDLTGYAFIGIKWQASEPSFWNQTRISWVANLSATTYTQFGECFITTNGFYAVGGAVMYENDTLYLRDSYLYRPTGTTARHVEVIAIYGVKV